MPGWGRRTGRRARGGESLPLNLEQGGVQARTHAHAQNTVALPIGGGALGQGHRQRRGGHVAPLREGQGDTVALDADRLDNGVRVGIRNLVGHVGGHVVPLPAVLVRLLPGLRHELQAVPEQALGVGVHTLIGLAADAQVAVLGARAGYRTDDAVALRVAVSATNHCRRRTRTEGQGRELRQHILAGRIGVVQDAHRGTVPRGGILTSHNEGVVDSARINHGGGDGHRVHEAQAGVRNIEV